MTNVKSPYESRQICNLLLIIISMQDLIILPQLSKLLGVISLILITYKKKILLIFYFSVKILKILTKNFFLKIVCFPSNFIVFFRGSRRGTLIHLVIKMCTSMSAFHRRFPCSQHCYCKVFHPPERIFMVQFNRVCGLQNVFATSHFHSRLKCLISVGI